MHSLVPPHGRLPLSHKAMCSNPALESQLSLSAFCRSWSVTKIRCLFAPESSRLHGGSESSAHSKCFPCAVSNTRQELSAYNPRMYHFTEHPVTIFPELRHALSGLPEPQQVTEVPQTGELGLDSQTQPVLTLGQNVATYRVHSETIQPGKMQSKTNGKTQNVLTAFMVLCWVSAVAILTQNVR